MGGGLRIQLLLRYKSGEKEQDSGGYCTLNRYCCKITRYKCDCPVSKNDHVTCVVVSVVVIIEILLSTSFSVTDAPFVSGQSGQGRNKENLKFMVQNKGLLIAVCLVLHPSLPLCARARASGGWG